MAGKKNNSWNYWQMNYRGRFRRTKKMIPFIIVLCVLLLILGVLADDLGQALVWIVLLAVVGVAQYFYTKKKADEEEAQEQAAQNATAQAAQPGTPGYVPQGAPAPQGYAPAGYPAAAAAPNAAPATPGYASAPNYSAPASAAPQAPFAPGAAPQAPIPSPEAQNAQPSAPTAPNAQAGPTVPPTTAAPAPSPASNAAAAPQQGGTNPFEQETGSLQMQMAYLAASLPNQDAISNGTIQTVYVHAAVQNGAPTWDCFFRSGNALVASGDLLKNTPAEARSQFFDSGRALVSQYLQACAKYGVDAPTELRITYDPRAHSLHTDVNYQPLTGTGDQDPFMTWASSVYASFSGTNS